jgi:hypothetical protein
MENIKNKNGTKTVDVAKSHAKNLIKEFEYYLQGRKVACGYE